MIGVIDSGIGGLSIYADIKKKYPQKAIVYFADKKNFPYGEKTDIELLNIVRNAVDLLILNNAKIVVLACNSATVATAEILRAEYNIPIIGVEPAVKVAAREALTGKIGVLATKRTVEDHRGDDLAPGCSLTKSHNGKLVALIENNFENITDADLLAAIRPFTDAGVDSVVLGCTHYHFVRDKLERLLPRVSFYTPGEAVARRLVSVAMDKNIELLDGNDIFLCSADVESFAGSLKILLGKENEDIRKI